MVLRGARFPGGRPGVEPCGLKTLGEFKVLLSRNRGTEILVVAPVPGPGSNHSMIAARRKAGGFPLVFHTAKG